MSRLLAAATLAVTLAVAGCASVPTAGDPEAAPATVELTGTVTEIAATSGGSGYMLDHEGVFLPIALEERPAPLTGGVVVEVPEGVTLPADEAGIVEALRAYTADTGESLVVVDLLTAG